MKFIRRAQDTGHISRNYGTYNFSEAKNASKSARKLVTIG